MANQGKIRRWGQIVLILVVVAFGTGLLLGVLNLLFPVPQFLWKGGIGAVVGITAALLIAERQGATRSKEE
jgi:hypothetical protein